MPIEYRKGSRCGFENCPSREYYIQDGLTYCRRDHQQDVPLQTQVGEDEEFPTRGRKTRKEKVAVEKRVSRVYRGKKAIELYLQCYQLILRKQCYSLIHDKGFPPELENVVHDLWSLRLQLLKDKIDEDSASDGERRLYSSQNETTENEVESTVERTLKQKRVVPRLVDTLGLCYFAMILLRAPICLGDLQRWAVDEEIPYVRAIRLVPRVMKSKLPQEYIGVLDPRCPLKPGRLHDDVHRSLATYYRHFDLIFPPLNYHPLLLSFIQRLAIPIDLYTSTIKIAEILPDAFTFPKPTWRQRTTSLPEIQLICILIIAVKLHHPFDNIRRHTQSPTDIGTLAIDWDAWTTARQEYLTKISKGQPPSSNAFMATTDRDVLAMSAAQMDDYLDWYEKTWIDDDHDPNEEQQKRPTNGAAPPPKQILDMFPTARLNPPTQNPTPLAHHRALTQRINHVQRTLKVRRVTSTASASASASAGKKTESRTTIPIGALYKRYRRANDLLRSEHARSFYEASAEVVGMSLEMLVKAVYGMETQLENWRDREKRRKRDEEEEGSGDDDDEGEGEESGNDLTIDKGLDGETS
ncbi:Pol I core factor CF [Varicellaria rhodocarpa]|nr:Pol I core factor CF [Varicellaria rhodocarpa]